MVNHFNGHILGTLQKIKMCKIDILFCAFLRTLVLMLLTKSVQIAPLEHAVQEPIFLIMILIATNIKHFLHLFIPL